MKRKYLNKNIRIKVKKYLEYLWNYDIDLIEEEDMLTSLSETLRDEVMMDVNFKHLRKCKLLLNFSEEFLKKLAIFTRDRTFFPEEEIFDV